MKKNAANNMQPVSLQLLGETKSVKPRGKAGFFSGLLIGFLSVLALLALFAVALWFDLFSLKQEVAIFMQLEKAQLEVIEQRRLDAETQEAKLLDLKRELEEEADVLDRQRQNLLTLEASLHEAEAGLDQRAERIASQETELDELVALYEQMPPDKAAEILMISEDKKLTARLLNRMDQQRLSLILTQLSAQDAASLIDLIAGTALAETALQTEAEGSTP